MRISVYNQISHIHALTIDLQRAKLIVIIQSPFLAEKNIEWWAPELKALIARGVIVCVFVNLPEHYYDCHPKPHKEADNEILRKCVAMLEALGVHVNLIPKIHTKLIVIDYRWLWDGSLNFLSSNREYGISERANRYDDVIHTMAAYICNNLERCTHCESRDYAASEGIFLLDQKSILQTTPIDGKSVQQKSDLASTQKQRAPKGLKMLKYPAPEWRSKGKLSYSIDRDFVALAKNEKSFPSQIGIWLHLKRTELKFRASDLMTDLGLTKRAIASIETGRVAPTLDSLVRFVQRLGWQIIIVPQDIVPLIDYIVRSYHRSDVAAMAPQAKPYRLLFKAPSVGKQQRTPKASISTGTPPEPESQTSFEPPTSNLASEPGKKSAEGEVNPSQRRPSD